MKGSEFINLLLGLCAVWYSYVPPERIKNYRRPVALLVRYAGFILTALSLASVSLRAFAR